jgi:hypothetical protein
MARRELLTDEQWMSLLAAPNEEREIVRHYTLSKDDIDLIATKHSDHSRLGFAMLLCYLRYPGRVLEADEMPPPKLLAFVADQLELDAAKLKKYRQRDQTRREQLSELMTLFDYHAFDRASSRQYIAWLIPIAQTTRNSENLVRILIEEMRRQRILLPVSRVIEMLARQARTRAELVSYRALINGLSEAQRVALDTLLAPRPDTLISSTTWLRRAPQSPTSRNILALIERVIFVRKLNIEQNRQRNIPQVAFDQITGQSLRMTVQYIRDLEGPRRYATLVVLAIVLETDLTDATVLMFDKLVGSLARKAERKIADNSLKALRQAQGNLRTLAIACRAVIDARDRKADPFTAIDTEVGWNKFIRSVAEAESLAQTGNHGYPGKAYREIWRHQNTCSGITGDF